MEETISIAWWNTGVSPAARRDRSTLGDLTLAFGLIADVIIEYDIDVFCLSEISPFNVDAIRSSFENAGFYIYDGTYTEGRIKHDMCVLVKQSKLTFIDSKSITEQSILGKIRAGQELQLMHNESGDNLYFYISHWPSRANDTNDGMPKRYELGKALRGAIERCAKDKDGKYFVLIGDYNDDPFNESITHALGASRDRDLVLDNELLFYNPFWNFMGASINFPLNNYNLSTYGTYFYKKGSLTRWHTFDQMIFSSSFLSCDKWRLLEEKVKIVNDERIKLLVTDSSTNFDHLPIISVIKRG